MKVKNTTKTSTKKLSTKTKITPVSKAPAIASSSSVGSPLLISTERTGNFLTVKFSLGLPARAIGVVASIMSNAARYSQTHLIINSSAPNLRLSTVLQRVKATVPRRLVVQNENASSFQGISVTTAGILPSLDKPVIHVIGQAITAWQRYARNPTPLISYIEFSDGAVVASAPKRRDRARGSGAANTGSGSEEPGLVAENWITGLIAAVASIGLAALIAGDAAVEAVAGLADLALDAVDSLLDALQGMVDSYSNDPDNPDPDMPGLSPSVFDPSDIVNGDQLGDEGDDTGEDEESDSGGDDPKDDGQPVLLGN